MSGSFSCSCLLSVLIFKIGAAIADWSLLSRLEGDGGDVD